MSLLVFASLVLIFIFSVRWLLSNRARQKYLRNLPGIPPSFLIGNISWALKMYSKKLKYHPAVYIMQRIMAHNVLYKKHGLHLFWFGPKPVVSIFSPELMELALSSNISLEKSFEYTFLHRWLGTGLLTSTGSKWRSRRKLLTPSFHFRILDDFLPTFNDQSMILVKKLRTLVQEEYVDILPLVVLCTLDIVCETVMGCPIGAQKGENSEYVTAIHNLGDFFNKRTVMPWLWSDFLYSLTKIGKGFDKDIELLHNFTEKVIREKKKSKLANRDVQMPVEAKEGDFQVKKKKALMDLLLDLHFDGQQLSEKDIREEVDTFMFEGHDTTAMGLTFALYCIGLYPEIQEKIHEELDAIFEDDPQRASTMEDVRSMKYLECVIKEAQRLYPSVPIIGRMLNEDIAYENIMIPKGTTLHLNFFSLHRNGDIFPDPERFDPERFAQENVLQRHPYAYTPFSAGPRNCIGQKFALMEEKVVLSNILREFDVVSLDPRDKVQVKIEFTLRPEKAIRLKFIPRK